MGKYDIGGIGNDMSAKLFGLHSSNELSAKPFGLPSVNETSGVDFIGSQLRDLDPSKKAEQAKNDLAKLEAEQAARRRSNITPVAGDIKRRIAGERKAGSGGTGRLSTMMTSGSKLG